MEDDVETDNIMGRVDDPSDYTSGTLVYSWRMWTNIPISFDAHVCRGATGTVSSLHERG